MLNTDELMNQLRDHAGARLIADLGIVHQGRMGYSDCTTTLAIERWESLYFFQITVTHQKNGAGRMVRSISWPYSRSSATDLGHVLADWRIVEKITETQKLPDTRGWFARGLDKLIGSKHLGSHQFGSRLDAAPARKAIVTAAVGLIRGQGEIALHEDRLGHGTTLAQFSQAACASIREALTAYAGGQGAAGNTTTP